MVPRPVTSRQPSRGDTTATPRTSTRLLDRERQQGTLAVIYELDQENERGRRADAARGHYDKTPAAEWRLLDFAHDPSLRELLGPTAMQAHLESRGWDNQGNGSTMAALVKRGLVVHGEPRPTRFGRMMRVKLTNQAGRPPGQACPRSRAGSRRTCCPPHLGGARVPVGR